MNQSQSDTDTDKNKEEDYNTLDFNNYNMEKYSNIIGNNCNINTLSNRIFPENEKMNINFVKEIEIDPDKDLNIGFELGNSTCRIGIINNSQNNIELFQFYDDEDTSIPTIISFKDSNDNILIGREAEEERINNPNYTIFNFVKLIDKNYDEIEEMKELWGFKLYNNPKSKKPYIKGYQKNFRKKIYSMEDILTLFLKNIFDKFFSKFKIKKNKCELLRINFVVAVPNNFNYLQRKILEKIFLTQLFKQNLKFDKKENIYNIGKNNIENIQIKNIKIENSSNLGFLYPFYNQIKINKKIILIYIEGSSVNISLISASYINKITSTKKLKNETNNNIYEIKGIEWTSFGEEDFIDNFESICLSKELKEICYKNPAKLAILRKIFEKAKNEFYKNPQNEVVINSLFNNNDFKMILSRNDYEKSCEKQFNIIINSINQLLKKSKLSENHIDDIIFIGNTTDINIIKQKILKEIINRNKSLYNKLFENNITDFKQKETNPNLIVIGAIIQSYNLFSKEKGNFIFQYKEISPISFGVEDLNKNIVFMIKKGSQLPIKVNKNVKFPKVKEGKEENIIINIYEGDEEFSYKNKLITKAILDTNIFKNEIHGDGYVEVLLQFIINQNFDLRVFILDTKTKKRKIECIINIDITQEK